MKGKLNIGVSDLFIQVIVTKRDELFDRKTVITLRIIISQSSSKIKVLFSKKILEIREPQKLTRIVGNKIAKGDCLKLCLIDLAILTLNLRAFFEN